MENVGSKETSVVLISLLPISYFSGLHWNIDEVFLGRDFKCSLVGGFFTVLRLIAIVPVCRTALVPLAGDLEVEIWQRAFCFSFTVGALLILGDYLVLPQFCGCLEDFLEPGLTISAAHLKRGRKKKKEKEKPHSQKIIKISLFLQENAISSFQVGSQLNL